MPTRAAKKYITKFLKEHPDASVEVAQAAWDALTPELQAHLIILSTRDEQNGNDIREGLLATLNDYQGVPEIKKLFEKAIKSVRVD